MKCVSIYIIHLMIYLFSSAGVSQICFKALTGYKNITRSGNFPGYGNFHILLDGTKTVLQVFSSTNVRLSQQLWKFNITVLNSNIIIFMILAWIGKILLDEKKSKCDKLNWTKVVSVSCVISLRIAMKQPINVLQ